LTVIQVERLSSEVIVDPPGEHASPTEAQRRPPAGWEERFHLRELLRQLRRDAARTALEGVPGDHEF
jgi:hypothetical protein